MLALRVVQDKKMANIVTVHTAVFEISFTSNLSLSVSQGPTGTQPGWQGR